METSSLTIKGQIVVPSRIRRKLGLKKAQRLDLLNQVIKLFYSPLIKDIIKALLESEEQKVKL